MAHPSPSRRGILAPAIAVAWLLLIFGTSCTVIRPQEFFALVQRYVLFSEASIESFQNFWGIWWFAIVKGWHAAEFAILVLLVTAGLRWWTGRLDPRTIGAALLFAVGFAITDEWHQSFVPDRVGSVSDVLIDTLGALVAAGILLVRVRRVAPSVAATSGPASPDSPGRGTS